MCVCHVCRSGREPTDPSLGSSHSLLLVVWCVFAAVCISPQPPPQASLCLSLSSFFISLAQEMKSSWLNHVVGCLVTQNKERSTWLEVGLSLFLLKVWIWSLSLEEKQRRGGKTCSFEKSKKVVIASSLSNQTPGVSTLNILHHNFYVIVLTHTDTHRLTHIITHAWLLTLYVALGRYVHTYVGPGPWCLMLHVAVCLFLGTCVVVLLLFFPWLEIHYVYVLREK